MKKIFFVFDLGLLTFGIAQTASADGRYHYSGGMEKQYPNIFGRHYGYVARYSPLMSQFNTPAPYFTPANQSYGYPNFWQQQNPGQGGTSAEQPTAGYHYYPAMPNTMMPSYWYGR